MKPILTVCAVAAVALKTSAVASAIFCIRMSLLLRWRILTEQPRSPEGFRERGAIAFAVLLHSDACSFTTHGELLRMTARERVARDRRRRRRGTELLCDRGTLADENAPARGVELHAVAHRARNHGGKARPARRGLDRILRHHEHLFEAQEVDVACAPDVLRRE